jgi:hypothetical protein
MAESSKKTFKGTCLVIRNMVPNWDKALKLIDETPTEDISKHIIAALGLTVREPLPSEKENYPLVKLTQGALFARHQKRYPHDVKTIAINALRECEAMYQGNSDVGCVQHDTECSVLFAGDCTTGNKIPFGMDCILIFKSLGASVAGFDV